MKHFTIKEMCKSASHPELVAYPAQGTQVYRNLVRLIETVLDPIRDKIGQPVVVSSGYRSERLNAAVGGSKTSAHRYGLAADITTGKDGADNLKIVAAALDGKVPYDQIIFEYPTFDSTGSIATAKWIHIGLSQGTNRKQMIYTTDGKSYKPVKQPVEKKYVFKR